MSPGAPVNPFVTANLALPFVERTGEPPGAAPHLLRCALKQGHGEIVGPEGTGKTTLLRALLAEATTQRLATSMIGLPAGRRWPPSSIWKFLRDSAPGALLLLDSADQLSPPARWLLRAACRAARVTLVVASHRPLGLQPLRRTSVDDDLFMRLTERILARSPGAPALVSINEAPDALRRSGGNAREALFALYDRYEQRWPHER